MNNSSKRPCAVMPDENEGFPLPDAILFSEVFARLELESLCTLACVCRTLRSMTSQALSTLPSLNLSAFSPNGEVVHHITSRLGGVKSVTIDCLHLDDSSVISILGPQIQELNLLKCASLSYYVLLSIGEKFPNLRMLVLELAGKSSPEMFKKNLIEMLKNLLYLEHLCIKVRGTENDAYDLTCIDLPKTLRFLKLQPVTEQGAVRFIEEREILKKLVDSNITSYLGLGGFSSLHHLSLVLNVISGRLMASIASSLPLLVELDLEDRPCTEPKLLHDLTNSGLQFLGSCQNLIHLSIVRSRLNYPASFKRVNDVGVLLLAESCRGLESVRLGGFSKVTDAGFSSLVHSACNLTKLEIRSAPLLSDLAFHNIIGAVSPLIELKLVNCPLITSAAVAELASSSALEMLDTYGCRSIADPCLDYIARLSNLASINIGGADITDNGLGVLSKGDLPITKLCFRGCTRVTDRGIICLLDGGTRIKKTLSSLDISHMPGISDRAIHALISSADALTELCMRRCFHVTNDSLRALASRKSSRSNQLQKLDIFECVGFSIGLEDLLLEGPSFEGLRWLGVGKTHLAKSSDSGVVRGRWPYLTVCFEGCEVGCHDGWQFHG